MVISYLIIECALKRKKLSVSIALLVCMFATAAIAAEPGAAGKEARRAEKLRAAFDQCDKNKDGVLSFEEFAECKAERKGKDKRKNRQHPDKKPGA